MMWVYNYLMVAVFLCYGMEHNQQQRNAQAVVQRDRHGWTESTI